MSTKTTIKRVALVAAVALTLGGFSAVSASAASTTAIAQVAGTGDAGVGGVAGPANSLQITVTPDSTLTTKKTFVTVTGGTITGASETQTTVAANGASAITNLSSASTLTIGTPTAGSIVINVYDAVSATNFSSTVSVTKTITVSATAIAGTYSAAKSSIFIAAGRTNTVATADPTTAITVASTAAANGDTTTAAATIQVLYNDANGTAINADSITATITSGPGTINGATDSASATTVANVINQYSMSLTPTAGAVNFVVWPNGQVGPSTITIKNSAGTVLATKTITFAGTTVASIKATVKKAYVLNSTTATNKAIALNLYDSAGNEITSNSSKPTPTVVTGSTVGGTAVVADYDSTNGVYYVSVVAQAGQAAKTTDASETYTFTSGTVTATATVMFVNGVASSVTISADPSVESGSKITYSLTAKNANGNALPDGAYTPGSFIAAAAPSASLVSVPFAAADTVTLVNGVATATTYAPFGSAPLTITWTLAGTAGTANAAGTLTSNTYYVGAGLVKTITGTDVSVPVTINGSADSALAVDAANAATDAANAAAEEASNATEAASEALAAVNSLATTVASLIAGIKAQLTSLTALIKKIQAKVKA